MVKKLKQRDITRKTERELWARSAGRCAFDGCNRPLYISPVTSERLHVAERAHIYSFSEKGPRGWGPFRTRPEEINDPSNLLLVCRHCHTLIDEKPERYPADLLIRWKCAHESRVWTVTGICPSKSTHVVLYGANIGDEKSLLQPEVAKQAVFPDRYPSQEKPIELGMTWEGKDDNPEYWRIEEENLIRSFQRHVRPLMHEGGHFSVFSLATIPLMVRLGSLLTDKTPVSVYQLLREPEQAWSWDNDAPEIEYTLHAPGQIKGPPALILSLSSEVKQERVLSVLGQDVTVWELTHPKPHNDYLRSRQHLSAFRSAARQAIAAIAAAHGTSAPLAMFPAMPVSASIELGRIRMPKVDMPWVIHDHNRKLGCFAPAITLGGSI